MKQQRPEIQVMFVRTEDGPARSAAAFQELEGRLPTLRGRKFFATCRGMDYRACVEWKDGDDPRTLGLDVGVIPGGLYVRKRLEGGPENIAATLGAMAEGEDQDTSRPCIEFYRRQDEVILFLPVADD